jgi:transcriptional regulator with XRE-family HTH domain
MEHPLKKARTQRGLSQGRLSELSGIGTAAISHIENRRRRGRPETLQKLALPLGLRDWRKLQED